MGLELAVSRDGLCVLANRQLSLFNCAELVDPYMERVLGKLEYCFLRITNKYYRGCSGGGIFPHSRARSMPSSFMFFQGLHFWMGTGSWWKKAII